jgi:hypothetical protein
MDVLVCLINILHKEKSIYVYLFRMTVNKQQQNEEGKAQDLKIWEYLKKSY